MQNAGDENTRGGIKLDFDPCFRASDPPELWCCELNKPNKCYSTLQACRDNCH